MKANDNNFGDRIVLPLPPEDISLQLEMDIYARFMRHLRMIPHSRAEVKILTAIQFVSDMTACSEAHVTKVLVDLGLRAPRFALPAEYLDFADSAIIRSDHDFGAATNSLKDLDTHWTRIGEERYSAARTEYSELGNSLFDHIQ
ncbi:MAG: hypothetical protein CMH28_01400 [Micavibrio sp.]|nr:hypothetical protein [Micavibrio sp.]|tara:strand:- start:27 stop:458 length:432 start_codon:yes stop_codon:yes gene_type:complete